MKAESVPIKGWVDLDTAFRSIQELPAGYPRMLLVHGEPGLGKTTAVDKMHLKYGGAYMVASSTWSQRVMLEKLAERLGLTIRKQDRIANVLDTILADLERKPDTVIVIDEFDRVAHKTPLVELVREIYDVSDVPIALVGMGTIEKTLSDIPQFPQRIGQRVRFTPLDLEDARRVAVALCEVSVTDDLLKKIFKRSGGVVRLLVTELAQIEARAKRDGIDSIGIADLEGS